MRSSADGRDRSPGAVLRPQIALSWQRASSSGLDPGSAIDPDETVEIDTASRLRRAAQPVLDDLAEQLAGSRYAVILADRTACLVDMRFGHSRLASRLEERGAVLGRVFTESTTGTNSIATALEIRRGIAVHGTEHYLEQLKAFSCYGVPVVDPLTRRSEGVLDITCLAEDDNGLLRPFLARAAREIEAGLLADVRRSHMRVLAAFEAASVRTNGALVAFGADLVLANDAAHDLLQPVDHATLRTMGAGVRARRTCETDLASGVRVVATVDPVREGGGFLVALERSDRAPRVVPRIRRPALVPDRSAAFDWYADLRGSLEQHRRERASVIVHGEAGSGRSAVALDIVGAEPSATLDGALGGVRDVERLCAGLVGEPVATLLVREAHLLAPAVAAHVARLLDEHDLRLVLTAGPEGVAPGETAALAARCPVRVVLPPLRTRRDRVPVLAAAMLRERSDGATRFTPTVLRALAAQDWPGNLRELATLVAYVAERRSAGDVTEADLPPGYRSGPREPVPGALWQAERDTIIRVLVECGGNKVHAARQLGISRNMLYRRLRVLHIRDADWPSVPNTNT